MLLSCGCGIWFLTLRETTPTESSQSAEEGVDLNEGGNNRGVEKRNVFTGQMILEVKTMRWVGYVARAVEYRRD